VIDDQIHRDQRLDHFGVATQPRDGGAHGRKIHQQRHSGEVLQHHPGDDKWDLHLRGLLRVPVRERFHILLRNLLPVAIAQHALEDDANGYGKPRDRPHSRFFQGRQRIKAALLPRTGIE
jgi:hypothetical protein